MASSSSLSLSRSFRSSSFSQNWDYNVFPSFHGPDVRKGFLSHLIEKFKFKGIKSFIDNEIKRGESIGPELKRAIRGSKIALVLLSKNYASSSWCLDELVEIMNKGLGQTVMTVFYDVDPTNVKKQTGDFGKAFGETCKGKTEEEIDTWRKALEGVATIAGYTLSNWETEAAMVDIIATDISNILNLATRSRDFDDLIGMKAHMERMEPLLCLDLDEVRMIGICGSPGIGKSTISRFLFYQFSNSFQLTSFMGNIKQSYPQLCDDEYSRKQKLQSQMLSDMLNQKDVKVHHLGVAKERLKDKKVLLVIDDVDQLEQLDALAEKAWWFGPGSRIIITTQDRQLLERHGINHIYKVEFPSTNEASQMFCMYAFGQECPKDGFREHAWKVANLVSQLPLALRVMGSHFKGMSKQGWENALPSLKTRLHIKIESALKFSYDALCDDNKNLFLHIACYFNSEEFEKVVEYLANSFENVKHRLDVLAEKSLIFIENSKIGMHSLLVELGREIVRKQSIDEPGQRQFLVDNGEICEVLTDEAAGSRSVIGIDFRFNGREVNISGKAFERMSNLQFLRLYGCYLSHGLTYLSPKLRILHWDLCPATCLPSNVNLKFLVELVISNSNLRKLWDGIKRLPNLKWMNLSLSYNLKELPDLSTAPNLKELNLSFCKSLMELPSSIGNATSLQKLNLSCCTSLVVLPSSIGNVNSLQELNLSYCSSLVELPSSIGNATSLQELNLSYCSSLVELPSSIKNATSLQELNLSYCSSLVELPSYIRNATSLQKLNLRYWRSLMELPSFIGNATSLQNLNLSCCTSLVEIPSSIENAISLQQLNLSCCTSLVKLPSSIGNVTSLQQLDLSFCRSLVELPSSIGNAISLRQLNLDFCKSLVKLPSSIENATSLQQLNLNFCKSLVEVPASIGNLINLDQLCFARCSSLVEAPSSIGNLINLRYLGFSGCSSLLEIPASIGNLINLHNLDLSGCSSLEEAPASIGNLINLHYLDFSGCSSLVKVPAFIGNLHKLMNLTMKECSKLEVLPVNVKLKSLDRLVLSGCSSLKSFPEISQNIKSLDLSGTAIEVVPSFIWSCSRLEELDMSYCKNLKEFSHALDNITERDRKRQKVSPFAENCESLERLDCSFPNPYTSLNFAYCFKLNKEARDLIIQTSTNQVTVLPGGDMPTYFTYRANGGSLVVKLNERPFCSTLIFKVCFMLVRKKNDDVEAGNGYSVDVHCGIMDKQHGLRVLPLTKHLYIFEVESGVTSNELFFEIGIYSYEWVIKECGVHYKR